MIPTSHPRMYLTCPNPAPASGKYLGIIIPLDKIAVLEAWNYWGPVPLSSNTIYADIVTDQLTRGEKSLYAHFHTEKLMVAWATKIIHRAKNPHLYQS